MCKRGFGFGASGTKSNNGVYSKFGQSYGIGDTIGAVLDADKHCLSFLKNGVALPGDAFKLERALWEEVMFGHVLVKGETIGMRTHLAAAVHTTDVSSALRHLAAALQT